MKKTVKLRGKDCRILSKSQVETYRKDREANRIRRAMRAIDLWLEFADGEPRPLHDVYQKATWRRPRILPKELRRAAKRLGVKIWKPKFSGQWYCRVPLTAKPQAAGKPTKRSAASASKQLGEHDAKTMKVYRDCYLKYRLHGKPRRVVFQSVRRRYGYPKDESSVTLFSSRYAKYRQFPKSPVGQERANLLAQIDREIQSENTQNAAEPRG